MTTYEYKVVPAPKRGLKAKGVKTTEDRFAHALEEVMNPLGAQGWDYVRTDTLPCEERVGLTGRRTEFQNMLVFRRALPEVAAKPATPALSATPAANAVAAPAPIPAPQRAEPALTRPEPRVSETLSMDRPKEDAAETAQPEPGKDQSQTVAAE